MHGEWLAPWLSRVLLSNYLSRFRHNHFCELSSLLSLSYSDSSLSQPLLFPVAAFNEVITLLVILTSCVLTVVSTWRRSQLVVVAKPSPPAPPAWPPSASSPAPSSSSTLCPAPHPPGSQSKWRLCFTRRSSPRWIPWSTVWEIRMSRTQSANYWKQNCFHIEGMELLNIYFGY